MVRRYSFLIFETIDKNKNAASKTNEPPPRNVFENCAHDAMKKHLVQVHKQLPVLLMS